MYLGRQIPFVAYIFLNVLAIQPLFHQTAFKITQSILFPLPLVLQRHVLIWLALYLESNSGRSNILKDVQSFFLGTALHLSQNLMDLKSLLDYRRSNQSILKEISPDYSLQGLMLKLKLQSFGHLMQRTDSLEKTLMLGRLKAGKEVDDRGRDGWMASPTWWTWVWASSGRQWRKGRPGILQSMRSQRADTTEQLNWTENPVVNSRSSHIFIILHFSIMKCLFSKC